MSEFQQTAESSPQKQQPFPQEIKTDHIHMVPDSMNDSDSNLLRQIRTGQLAEFPVSGAASAAVQAKPPELSPCPISPEYDQIMLRAYHNMYEPSRLGDFEQLRNKYNCKIKNVDDAVRYAGEALSVSKDPYNSVFDKKQSEERGKESAGVWHGFGFNFVSKADTTGANFPSPLKISGTVDKSPVAINGIKPGDYIVAIDGVPLKGKTFDSAFALIKDGTKKFTMLRDGKRFDLKLTATDVDTPAVTEKSLDSNIAYIKVATFGQSDTSDELKAALEKHPDADGYILDLRQNPGGFFDEAIKAASLFVKEGTVVSVRQRIAPTAEDIAQAAAPKVVSQDASSTTPADGTAAGGVPVETGKGNASALEVQNGAAATSKAEPKPNYEKTTYELTADTLNQITVDEGHGTTHTTSKTRLPDLVDKPTVILVDEDSASSSEVFTGALKDHGDAVVVGTRTYGKGIGQMNYYNMPGGSTLRVTNFQYYTPNGLWPGDANTNRIGIMPNIVVANPRPADRGTDKDQQLNTAIDQIKKMLGRPN